MSTTHPYPSWPAAPAPANVPRRPDQQRTPLDISEEKPSQPSEACRSLPINAQGDMPKQRPDLPKTPADLPGLSATTKDILARVQNDRSTPVGQRPLNGYFWDPSSMARSFSPMAHSESGKPTGMLSRASTSNNQATASNPGVQNALPSGNSTVSRGVGVAINDRHQDVFDRVDEVSGSTRLYPASQTLHNSKPSSPETTIQVASAANSQASLIPTPTSTKSTPSSSSRRQRQYVLPDGTVSSGKGLGRGRPGIKRGPRRPRLDAASSGSSTTNTAAASSGPDKKRKRFGTDDEEHTPSRQSLSDDADSDDYTPKATHTRSGRHTQRPSTLVPTDTPATKKPRLAAETPNGHAKSAPRIRKRVYKGKEQNALCELCSRGRSTVDNAIVFCDGCNYCWHQECHDPRIPQEVVKDTTAQWFCKACVVILGQTVEEPDTTDRHIVGSGGDAVPVPAEVASPTSAQPLPPKNTTEEAAVTTALAPLVGARPLSMNQRHNYLNSLSREQLLDLLMRVSCMAPDLPIFPAPATHSTARIPSHAVPNSAPAPAPTTTPQLATTAGQSASLDPPINSMRPPPPPLPPLASPSNPNLNPSRAAKAAAPKYTSPSSPSSESTDESDEEDYDDDDDDDGEEGFRPSHSKCYPKPGQGLMARLPPDKADEHILLEGPESRTFSHSVKRSGTTVFGMSKLPAGDGGSLGEEDKENWDGRGR